METNWCRMWKQELAYCKWQILADSRAQYVAQALPYLITFHVYRFMNISLAFVSIILNENKEIT